MNSFSKLIVNAKKILLTNLSWFDFEDKPHLLCTVSDLTESKRTQAKLERERALLRCLIDSASDLIFIKDQDSVYLACNKASEAFIGMPEGEQIGKTDYDFFDRETAEEIRKADRQVFEEGKPLHIEEWVTGRDGRRLLMDTVKTPFYDSHGKPLGLVGIGRDATEQKLLEQERLAHLRFLESMDRVNRAIQGADDLEKMMKDLLDVVLSIFDCDRAFLLHPCDPDAPSWSIPMERTKPEYRGAGVLGTDIPMDPDVSKALRVVLESDTPVKFDPETKIPLPAKVAKRFGMKSLIAMTLHPVNSKPWEFGLHQCSYARAWTREEERLFQEIGRRLADGLSTILAHRDLRHSLEKLEQAQRLAHIGSWEVDSMDNLLIRSNEVFRILEIDPDKFDGSLEAFLESVHPEDQESVNLSYTTSLKNKASFDISYRLLFPDGRIKYLHGQCETIHEGDKPIRLIGTVQDITERKRAEERLRASEERLRLTLEATQIGIFDWDVLNDRWYVSPEYYTMLGYEPKDGMGDRSEWLARVHPDDRAHVEAKIQHVLARDPSMDRSQIYAYEARIRHADGIYRWEQVKGFGIKRDPQGRVTRMLGIRMDITERKQAEEEVRQLNETLEQRVAERTAELENRTQQLQKLALELSGAEDHERRHIASILHDDFQQQLAYIKMGLDQVSKKAAANIGPMLGLLSEMTGECIEKSRNLSYELNPPVLQRSGLLAALDALAKDMKKRQGLVVTVRKQKSAEPTSLSLASILYRSARELLCNVVKHAGVNSALMDIRDDDGTICLKVEDCGNGFNFDAARAGQDSGAGFGLYNIEDRITFLGGSMKVITKSGKGCCVILSVPKDVSMKTAVTEAALECTVQELVRGMPAAPISPIVEGEQIRVLLADDHKLMREALAKLLQGLKGLTIVGEAVNGNEAVQLAEKLKPHVILMDVTMPERDGFEATAQIKKNDPDVRVIGLSMHNDHDTQQKMFDAGASAYLTKTDASDTLVETIRSVYHGTK